MIGTFEGRGNSRPSDALIRHPYIDVSNAPDDATEQRLYDVYRFIRTYDKRMNALRKLRNWARL